MGGNGSRASGPRVSAVGILKEGTWNWEEDHACACLLVCPAFSAVPNGAPFKQVLASV